MKTLFLRATGVATLTVAIALIATVTFLSLNAFADGDGGHGGAGCKDGNGDFRSLFYCGAYKETPSTPPQAPPPFEGPVELAGLQKFVTGLTYLRNTTKQKILLAITPSFSHHYVSVAMAPDLTAPIVDRIKEEFSHATGLAAKNLELYAVTDTDAKNENGQKISITYILPGYFKLKTDEERMVALYHENLWVMRPTADYNEIIQSEVKFEAVVQQPTNTARMIELVKDLEGTKKIYMPGLVSLTLREDFENGNLIGFANEQGQVSAADFFGAQNIQCYTAANQVGDQNDSDHSQQVAYLQCANNYLEYLNGLRRAHSQSQFLAYVGERLSDIVYLNQVGADDGIFQRLINILDQFYDNNNGEQEVYAAYRILFGNDDFPDSSFTKMVSSLFAPMTTQNTDKRPRGWRAPFQNNSRYLVNADGGLPLPNGVVQLNSAAGMTPVTGVVPPPPSKKK